MAIDSTIRSPRDGFLAPFKLLVLPNSSPFSLSSRVHTAFPLNSLRSFSLSLFLSVKAPEGENRPNRQVQSWSRDQLVARLVHQRYYTERVTIVPAASDREMARIKRENICTVMQFRPGSP